MFDLRKIKYQQNRREFRVQLQKGIGMDALASLMFPNLALVENEEISIVNSMHQGGVMEGFHHLPKAKRVIYLFQAGGPSQFELFDYKPELTKRWGQEMPDSVRGKQRLTGMLAAQSSYPLVGSQFLSVILELVDILVVLYHILLQLQMIYVWSILCLLKQLIMSRQLFLCNQDLNR